MTVKLKRFLIIAIVLAAVSAAAFRVWQVSQATQQASRPGAGRGNAARVVSVSVAEARSGQVKEEVEITGALKPKEQVDVSSKVTGRVVQIAGEVGSYVRRGDVIAILEDAELIQQVRRAEASQQVVRATLQQRRAELNSAKADLDRAKQLFDSGLIARQDYDAKTTSYQVFQAQVALTEAQGEQAAAELRELKIQQQQTRIQAPISGFVAQRFVDMGALVNPSTPVVRLVNMSTLVTVANVPERHVGKLRPGMRAVVHVDAFGETPFEGRVARIAPVLDAATRSAFVEVEIPNKDNLLRAEMFARVSLDLPTTRQAVLIPREALVYRGNQAGVFVVEQKKPTFRAVETGAAQGDDVEVLRDLATGTTVVSRGASMVREGDLISIVEQKEAERKDASPKSRRSQPGSARRAPAAALLVVQ